MNKQQVIFRDLCKMNYKEAWDYQEHLLQENIRRKSGVLSSEPGVQSPSAAGGLPQAKRESGVAEQNFDHGTQNYLLFVEHPPVYTLGKSGNIENVLLGENELAEKGIQFFRTNRGGD